MEKTVTLRFYDVDRSSKDKPAFADLLRKIAGQPISKRGHNITSEGIFVRLEDFSDEGDFIEGQFVRGQTGNRPGRMLSDGTDNLPFSEPIGHGIAFRYRIADGVLAIEYNPLVLSPSRVMEYLYEADASAEFSLNPRLRAGVWEELRKRPLRKLTLGIAGHPDVKGGQNDDSATWANLAEMRDRYKGHTIKIEIGMGHRDGGLAETAKDLIRDAFKRYEAGTDDIRTLRGTVETGDGVPNDEINLIGELLDVKEDLSFPGDDWAKFYTLRRDLLRVKLQLL
jgi:hypothetical protein